MKYIRFICLILCVLFNLSNAHAGPMFDKFKNTQMPKLQAFGEKNLSEFSGHVFYPFGGPDVTYPLLMFPKLETLTLMGLEPAGRIDLSPPVELDNGSLSSLTSLYRRSFFITDQMGRELKGVVPIILKQLENLGASDITVKAIEGKDKAVQIKCKYNGKERTINYYQENLSDTAINIDFLNNLKPFNVIFFKAASYLPHNKSFSKFREFVLENAENFVQDSTGVPYEHLQNNFNLTLFGKYVGPYKFPGAPKQADFLTYSKKCGNIPLDFFFSYGSRADSDYIHVLIATRKPKALL